MQLFFSGPQQKKMRKDKLDDIYQAEIIYGIKRAPSGERENIIKFASAFQNKIKEMSEKHSKHLRLIVYREVALQPERLTGRFFILKFCQQSIYALLMPLMVASPSENRFYSSSATLFSLFYHLAPWHRQGNLFSLFATLIT